MQKLDFLEALETREATKAFDPQKTLAEPLVERILAGVRLSPSSLGLQAWKILQIKNPEVRKNLRAFSFDQPQVTDASHFFVFLARSFIDEAYIDEHLQAVGKLRNTPIAELEARKKYILNYLTRLGSPEAIKAWLERQVYIPLANAVTLAALEQVDACPMEGFLPAKYNEYLGLHGAYQAIVCLALGYRKEGSSGPKKYRKKASDLFQIL